MHARPSHYQHQSSPLPPRHASFYLALHVVQAASQPPPTLTCAAGPAPASLHPGPRSSPQRPRPCLRTGSTGPHLSSCPPSSCPCSGFPGMVGSAQHMHAEAGRPPPHGGLCRPRAARAPGLPGPWHSTAPHGMRALVAVGTAAPGSTNAGHAFGARRSIQAACVRSCATGALRGASDVGRHSG